MSGGSHNYQYYQLNEYVESMKKYDPELAEMLSDVIVLCHDLEWFESGDYGYEDLQESMSKFKDRWMVATPELQERVKTSILDYCNKLERYTSTLKSQLKLTENTKQSLREENH